MSVVMVLIPLSLLLVGVAVWAFFWAVNSGQFVDVDTPGWEILTDNSVSGDAAGASQPGDHAPVTPTKS